MDIEEMALIGPGVNFAEIPAINQKRTLAFVNSFITNTVSILNNLATVSELKLQKFEEKLQRMDATLCILEAKLASIPGLDALPVVTPPVEPVPCATTTAEAEVAVLEAPPPLPPPKVEQIIQKQDEAPAPDDEDGTEPDPAYTKFFKMVQFGVPPQAVKLKMQSEGLDPAILDNPKSIPRVPKRIQTSVTSSDDDSD
ncbi:WASH complex subunit 3 [Cloeon dipterum]|uniref:WASH complex subunit 3 n=1 Tax=Cloeon dipterum TaxID=197152 RepID=UPI0032207384